VSGEARIGRANQCPLCKGSLGASTWRDFDTDARICERCATEDKEFMYLVMEMDELPNGTWDVKVDERE
jgi:hypothetical protein